jgi:hypothetical protein
MFVRDLHLLKALSFSFGRAPPTRTRAAAQIAGYALLGALGHRCGDSRISLFWLSWEVGTALQV